MKIQVDKILDQLFEAVVRYNHGVVESVE